MSELEKVEAVAANTVIEVKEPWYRKLWHKPAARKIVKGLAIGAACLGAFMAGRKAGQPNTALPAEDAMGDSDENDAE